MSSNISIDADFVINEQPDIQADLHINFIPDVSDFVTREELAEDLTEKQDVLTAGANIQIEDNVISATDTTYTAGEGISIEDNVISNTQTSAEWGNIEGDISDQTDLIDLIDTKIDIEATARENNDLLLQNGINTLNNDLTAEISNRGTADGILQGNIDTLSGTVTSNYNTLDGKITDEATARGNADTTLDGKIGDNKTAIDNHKADKNNPHEVTKSQIGLGNVDNTSDLNKPISTATQTALDGKVPTSRTVNNKALTSNITLSASDVGALPSTTTIDDLTTAEQQSALNSGATSTNIGQIATNTQNISNEVTNRQNADNNLQSQIDALVVSSDVFDVVGTYADLQAYDISTVPVNDIIKVLVDSTHDNAATYYRCVENNNVKSWSYIGAEGAYYTKSEADNKFVEQTTTVNGQALSSNITLDAEDVGALSDSTVIGNGTLTIQKNGSTIDTFGANDTGNTTVNIAVPTDTSDLTNGAGFITGIDSTDVTNALGYTPYNSTNPDGYTDNVGTVTSVNNTQPDANGNVSLSIPAAQVQSNWNETDNTSKAYIQNKPTIPSVGNGNLTITQGGTTKGTFNANASQDVTIDLDAGGGSSTDVQINGTSITSGGVADIVTNTAYNASSNKIATMSDLAGKQDVLTAGNSIAITTGTVDTRDTAIVTTVGNKNWQETAYVNNKFVAVGNDGYICVSDDGETWGTPYTVGSTTWRGIAYGNGMYVICGNSGKIAYSSDFVNWTTLTIGSSQWNDVTYQNNKFIAARADGYIGVSDDGVNWTTTQVASNYALCATYGNGLYVVGSYKKVLTSTDLINWTEYSLSKGGYYQCVTYAFGRYIAMSDTGYIATSTDGVNWTTIQISSDNWQEICFNENCIVAVGNSGYTTTSTNGTTWTTPVQVGTNNWYGLAYNNSQFVAVGVGGATTYFEVMSSDDAYISVVVDSDLSSISTNPVQNKRIYSTLDTMNTSINGKVPISRTVNGKALSSNITLTTSDISNCENTTNKVTSISSSSTDTEYPTAKCMYDIIGDVETLINAL